MLIREAGNVNNKRGRMLVVDSGTAICDVVRMQFGPEGFEVDHCTCYDDLRSIGTYLMIIISLDLGEPYHAVRVVKRCRRHPDPNGTGIITCSAKFPAAKVTHVLNAGADDYLHVPFSNREFVARIRAVLRRYV